METPLFISRLKTGFVSLSRKKTWGVSAVQPFIRANDREGCEICLVRSTVHSLSVCTVRRAMASFSGPIEGLFKDWPSL